MQHLFPALCAWQHPAYRVPHPPQPFRPGFIFGTVPLLQFLSNMLAERRAVASGGNSDLKFTTAYHRRRIEVTITGIVDSVAQGAGLACFRIDSTVDRLRIGCRDHQEIATRYARLELARDVPDPALTRPQADTRRDLRRYNRHIRGRAQHTLNFLLRDQATADDQHLVAFEL